MNTRITTAWTVGRTDDPSRAPLERVPAQVPGAVQLDWARAKAWPPYWQGDNVRAYDGLEDSTWIYATRVPAPTVARDERLLFVCGGVDYRCEVRIDGRAVHAQEGMFTPFEVDCTDYAGRDTVLEVVVFPAPKRWNKPEDRSQASACVKPPVSYGWDWHPRLIPLGIWQESHFEVRPAAHLRGAELRYVLDEAGESAALTLAFAAPGAADGLEVRWVLNSPEGQPVLAGAERLSAGAAQSRAELVRPQLWWPHDHGPQPLYRFAASLIGPSGEVLSTAGHRVGFRRARLVMYPGAWDEPAEFPKSRSAPPVTLEINGRAIFAKGSNWVNPGIFPGEATEETYRPLLQLARDAHFNLLRCWGGGPVSKEAFFDCCDELGLLVWQEFPLACNPYPDEAHYLEVLDRESRSILRRGRRHPCVVLWCGGNELFNVWSGLTDQSLPLRLLNRNAYDEDPQTPFLPTAPIDGMAHGGYVFREPAGREVFQIYAAARATAYSEFGCPGPSPVDCLKRMIPAEQLWPPRPGTAWETHHAFKAWQGDTWLCLDTLRHYFGEPTDLEALVAQGEWLQSSGYQCIFEEARRQKPRAAMALNWCFNEAWPTAANNSLIAWPARPKPAYDAVKASCRPVLASARLPKFSWASGEVFRAELWLLNDRAEAVPGGRLLAFLRHGRERLPVLAWVFPATAANINRSGPALRAELPAGWDAGEFSLELEVEGRPELASCYRLLLQPPEAKPPAARVGARALNA